MRAHRDRHARVDAGELLDGDRVLQRGAAGAPDSLGERDAHPPELAHLGHDRVGKRLRAIELAGGGSHFLFGELTHRALQELGLIVQVEDHGAHSIE